MTTKSNGDDGLAEDLLELAEAELEPPVDWTGLARALAPFERPIELTAEEREECLSKARAIAGDDTAAKALVERYATLK